MYLIDTHALVGYILDKLPKKVDEIFKVSEAGKVFLYIPTIVLAECLYLVEKGKIDLDFAELLRRIKNSENFVVLPFDFDVLESLQETNARDLHDRIIIATAKRRGLKVLTKDEEISRSGEVETIW